MLSRVLKEKYEKEKYIYTSNTDELTKCYNRRAYDSDMENLDLNTEWIYISLDLNGLKKANDTLGHSACLLYTSPSPRDRQKSRMPSSA